VRRRGRRKQNKNHIFALRSYHLKQKFKWHMVLANMPDRRHRVISSGTKRMATQNAPQGQTTAFDNAVAGNGRNRVSGTGGIKTTGLRKKR
jgi:hypothetical protein